MNIALIAHDKKKDLMVDFCISYSAILKKHNICATGTSRLARVLRIMKLTPCCFSATR